MSEITVNDGKGLYDNLGLIDTLILDCNDLPKLLFAGNNVAFCNRLVQMVTKLANLKTGIKSDIENRDKEIALLRAKVAELSKLI
jgi:hypothetical protein